jgi:hypothetical protein
MNWAELHGRNYNRNGFEVVAVFHLMMLSVSCCAYLGHDSPGGEHWLVSSPESYFYTLPSHQQPSSSLQAPLMSLETPQAAQATILR